MFNKLLASTAVAAFIATGGAFAQTAENQDAQMQQNQQDQLGTNIAGGQEIFVRSGDTILLESADMEITLRLNSHGMTGGQEMKPADQSASTDMDGEQDAAAMEDGAADTAETEEQANMAVDAESTDMTEEAAESTAETETDDVAEAPATGTSTGSQMGTQDRLAGEGIRIADGDILVVETTGENFSLNFEVSQSDAMASSLDTDEMSDDASTVAQTDVEQDSTVTSAINRDGMQARTLDQIRAEDLIGSNIYGANDEKIGEVGDVLLTQDGQVDAILVDVGGFLGIGEREVAIGLDNIQFMVDDREDWYVYTPFTEDQLKDHPEYDVDTFAEQRDQQLLIVR